MSTKFSIGEGQEWTAKNEGTVKDFARKAKILCIANGLQNDDPHVVFACSNGRALTCPLQVFATLYRASTEESS